jgi:hypothetical protein
MSKWGKEKNLLYNKFITNNYRNNYGIRKLLLARHQCLIPIILATWEADIGRITALG